jgi:outer membrane immunogenic protein
MFKKPLLIVVATTALNGSAFAADLPSRNSPLPFVPPAVVSWNGFYVGLNGGGISTSNRIATTGVDFGVPTLFGEVSSAAALAATNVIPSNRRMGFIGGAQVGYNWQWNNRFVVGTESDFQGTLFGGNCNNNGFGGLGGFGGFGGNNCGGTAINIVPIAGFFGSSVINQQAVSGNLNYLSTSRVRAGFLATDSLLIYATGGVAIGRVSVNSSILSSFIPFAGTTPGFSVLNDSRLRGGFVGGGGLEWMFLPNWSIKAEALYYDLGTSRVSQFLQQTSVVVMANTGATTSWRNNGVIIRAGLNYHLDWGAPGPVVARY